MPRGKRVATAALVALAVAGLVVLLTSWPPFRMAEARVFDVLSTVAPPDIAALSGEPGAVVVVAIDEPSFAETGLRWPWPRSLHAELVTALREAGARAIGLDLVFAEPSSPDEDAALAAAMGPDVVLASDESWIETTQAVQTIRTEPLPQLLASGVTAGLASVTLDPDGVLRRLPPWPDAFAAQVLAAAGEAAAVVPGYLQALGPARTYPTVSYYQALDPDAFLPSGFFKDKIVLVGLSLQTTAELESGAPDAFATSVTALDGRLTSGVEVQATILDNLRHGLAIRSLPAAANAALVLAAALLASVVAWRPADHWTFAGGAGLVLLLAGGSWAILETAQVFLPPVAPSLAVALVLGPIAARDQARERRMRREITRAFSQYLAPALVRQLARDPSRLKLGGERRTLTILFCDVRNFTPMAERMRGEPERLTELVNRILTPLSDAVLRHGGTIDKYIGDCVMAFWNAPLDDPDHALHAAHAALDMLASVERLNAELAAEAEGGLPRLAVGIGLNTGACVVGNMGSAQRFDYSALGDAVNYASRLEGASKTCGVPLLLSAEAADAVRGRLDPVLVDRIAVKGRSETAPVYTVLGTERMPAADLAAHDALLTGILAGRGADPAAVAALVGRQPALAPIYAHLGPRGERTQPVATAV